MLLSYERMHGTAKESDQLQKSTPVTEKHSFSDHWDGDQTKWSCLCHQIPAPYVLFQVILQLFTCCQLPFPLKWLYCFSKAFFFFLIHHLSPADRKQLYPFILLFIPSVFYFCISVNVHLDTQRRLNTDKCLELSQNTISQYECSFSSIFA